MPDSIKISIQISISIQTTIQTLNRPQPHMGRVMVGIELGMIYVMVGVEENKIKA